MKYLILFLFCMSAADHSNAQAIAYKPNPKAKKLDDSAVQVFTKCTDTKACYDRVNKLLDAAVKIDPKWQEGWANLMAFLGKTDQFDKCLAVGKKMLPLFPNEPSALFDCGIIQYKTGHSGDALATFGKLLKFYNDLLVKNTKSPNYNDILTQKAIVLILCNKADEGKNILRKLYTDEKDPYKKSYMAFYVNKTKEEIIEDKIPGK